MKESQIHHIMTGRALQEKGAMILNEDSKITLDQLKKFGFPNLEALANSPIHAGMDTAIVGPAVAQGSIRLEWLQSWLPGVVRAATQPSTIDEIVGVMTAGEWSDEEVLIRSASPVAKAELYGDHTNIPLASVNTGDDARGVVRFEQGFQVSILEEERQGRAGYDIASEKRVSAELSLELSRNRVGFYGFAAPNSRTFGLLNDPNLPAYVSASAPWATATFDQMVADLNAMEGRIDAAGRGIIKDDMARTLVIPTGFRQYMNKTNSFGMTVYQWYTQNYPNTRVITSPELLGANGGANVAYMFVDSVPVTGNTATDQTIIQIVPARFRVLGTEQRAKGYIEDFSNATAGVMVLKPWAVQRLTGL